MQNIIAHPDSSAINKRVLYSLALHCAACLSLAYYPPRQYPPPSAELSVIVDIIREQENKAHTPELPLDNTISPGRSPNNSGMITANSFLSSKTLQDPRSKAALVALRKLETDERMTQLCNLEAMEQVRQSRPDLQPDFVLAYALVKTERWIFTLQADGAALHSGRNWFKLRYKCEVTPDLEEVSSFKFALATEIPERDWQALSLPMQATPAQ